MKINVVTSLNKQIQRGLKIFQDISFLVSDFASYLKKQ
ncbi:hypothetical protein AB996_1242 [Lactococcus cremoris]|uniref:Uncharacterized protein n=1 Tax=Lactococcus lactis subsp. cremoris TaxID=1359 RepID=A0A166JP40_LACLC|nr:hypothetical protein AB996_1242 [Lactococcus cremoris]